MILELEGKATDSPTPSSRRSTKSVANRRMRPVAAVAADQRKNPPARTQLTFTRLPASRIPVANKRRSRRKPRAAGQDGGGNAELAFQHGSCDGKIPAIDVVDEDSDAEQ